LRQPNKPNKDTTRGAAAEETPEEDQEETTGEYLQHLRQLALRVVAGNENNSVSFLTMGERACGHASAGSALVELRHLK
jgi:hypothetical protein